MPTQLPQELVDNIVDIAAEDIYHDDTMTPTPESSRTAYTTILHTHIAGRAFRERSRRYLFRDVRLTIDGKTMPGLLSRIVGLRDLLVSNPTLLQYPHTLQISISSDEDALRLTSPETGLPSILTGLYGASSCPIDTLVIRGRPDTQWQHTSPTFRAAVYNVLMSGRIKKLTLLEIHKLPSVILPRIRSALQSLTIGSVSFIDDAENNALRQFGTTPIATPTELVLEQGDGLALLQCHAALPQMLSSVETLVIQQVTNGGRRFSFPGEWLLLSPRLSQFPVTTLRIAVDFFKIESGVAKDINLNTLSHLTTVHFAIKVVADFTVFGTAYVQRIAIQNTPSCNTLETVKVSLYIDTVIGYEDRIYHKDTTIHTLVPFFGAETRQRYPRMRNVRVEWISDDYTSLSGDAIKDAENKAWVDLYPPRNQWKCEIWKGFQNGRMVLDVRKV